MVVELQQPEKNISYRGFAMKTLKVKSYSKKILSLALIVIMLVSVFASSALTGHAAELEPSAESGYR